MIGPNAFDAILSALHEATFDDARWPAASALIDEACRIKGNMIVYGTGTSSDDVVIHLARLCYRGERNEEFERRYFEEYYHRDERVPRFRTLPDSRLVHVCDLYTEEEKRTSAAYNEALALSDTGNSVRARMDGPHGSRIVLSFADPVDARGWSCERIDLIERLLPHLRQYVRVRQALADVGGLSASFPALLDLRGTGVIQLDRRAWIVTANDRASDVLKARDALFDRDGALCARVPEDNDKLRSLLARALPPSPARGASGSMVVRRPFGLLPLVLHIVPVGDGEAVAAHVGALVLVVDPLARRSIDPGVVETMLGLTPAQSRVAVLLCEGYSVMDVAAATGRSVNTIRWHVRRIFEMQGISRLAQLVTLVRSLS